MQITLHDGTVLQPLTVTGTHKLVQGSTRDTISFIFPGDTDLEAIDRIFTPEACETIIINNRGHEFVHTGYVIRAELKRAPIEVMPATDTTEAVYEDRVTVSMSQRTYLETQIMSLTGVIDNLKGGN